MCHTKSLKEYIIVTIFLRSPKHMCGYEETVNQNEDQLPTTVNQLVSLDLWN